MFYDKPCPDLESNPGPADYDVYTTTLCVIIAVESNALFS